MSGYLQRLAASVGARPSRIRPVVDPLYAGSAGRFAEAAQGTPALEEEKVLVASRTRPERAPPRPAPAEHVQMPDHRAPNTTRPALDLGSEDGVAPASGFAGQVPDARAEPWVPAPPATSRAAAREESAPHAVELRTETGPAQPQEDHAPLVHRPSASVDRAGADASLVRRPAATLPGDRDGAAAQRRSGRDEARPATPDEIHINIGRVEIVAATQPPRAAAPARKATSLEDYLRDVSARRR